MAPAINSVQRARAAWQNLIGLFNSRPLTAPVFIIGCPRSGKTTLSKLLRPHPDLHFVTIRRHLLDAYPFYDLDQPDSWDKGHKLALDADDELPPNTRRLRQRLWAEARGQRILSDNATLSFRIGFLNRIFPDSQFVHVIRHGAETALEFEAAAQAGRMWARRPHMWRHIERYAQSSERYAPLLELCTSVYLRGLLQWRMTVETVRESAAAHLSPERHCEVRFEQLVAEPQATCANLAAFLGLKISAPPPPVELAFTPRPISDSYPAGTNAIAGELLQALNYSAPDGTIAPDLSTKEL